MPSFSCLIQKLRQPNRLRQSAVPSHKRHQIVEITTLTPFVTQSAEDELMLPGEGEVLHLVEEVATVLHQLRSSVAAENHNTNEASSSVSISLHFADLQRSTRALKNILKCHHSPAQGQENWSVTPRDSLDETEVEHPRGYSPLPLPDFSSSPLNFPDLPLDIHGTQSTYESEHCSVAPFEFCEDYSAPPPSSSSPHVAPLRLPLRTSSLSTYDIFPKKS